MSAAEHTTQQPSACKRASASARPPPELRHRGCRRGLPAAQWRRSAAGKPLRAARGTLGAGLGPGSFEAA